jgi:formylglycine-generating enzyme required for sulfatase activity
MRPLIVLVCAVVFGGALTSEKAFAGAPESIRDCADCPELVPIPVGEFVMGADIEEPRRLELPECNDPPFSAQVRPLKHTP